MSEDEKPRADWIAWSLQYVLGFILGAFGAWGLLNSGENQSVSRFEDWEMEFCLGGALFLAGLAAFYGDRWWLSNAYQVVQADGVRHSKTSAGIAAISWLVGLVIMGGILLKVLWIDAGR